MADATDLKSGSLQGVWVRVPPPLLSNPYKIVQNQET